MGGTVKHKTLKKVNALLILALFGTGAHAAAADKELLDILLKNGAINKDQYNSMAGKEGMASSQLLEILSKNGTITKDQYTSLTAKNPTLVAAAPAPAARPASDGTHVTFGHNGGLEIVSNVKEKDKDGKDIMDKEVKGEDGKPIPEFSFRMGGRVQVDSQVTANDPHTPPGASLSDGVGFRRARIYTEGVMFKDYEYRFEYDFARNNGGTQGITDAYVKYIHFNPFSITIGQQNEGKSMESVMSNNSLTFIERSLPNNAFIEQGSNSKYQLGIKADTYAKLNDMPYTLNAGITTESVGAPGPGNSSANSQGTANNPGGTNANATNINRNAFSGNTSWQAVGRATFAPIKEKDGTLLHTGVWGSWRNVHNQYNADGTLRTGGWAYQSQPDSDVDRTNWINTGNLTKTALVKGKNVVQKQVDSVGMFGAELAGAYGPVHLTSEYMQAQISGRGYGSSDTLAGYYAQVGWFITGETRPYDEKKGTWGRLIPKQNFLGGGGWGAWEIAYRYDLMDMNTTHINGGSINAGTLALNWYLTPRVRFMTDWVHVMGTQTGQVAAANAAANHGNTCPFPGQGSNASIGCFNGLSPDIWEAAVRIDY